MGGGCDQVSDKSRVGPGRQSACAWPVRRRAERHQGDAIRLALSGDFAVDDGRRAVAAWHFKILNTLSGLSHFGTPDAHLTSSSQGACLFPRRRVNPASSMVCELFIKFA
jgi:hypothetical protein